MDVYGRTRLRFLTLALLWLLPAITVSSLQSVTGEINALSAWETEETDSLLALLCAQPAPSLSPPSSAHAVRPSDVTVLSAIGLPSSSRSEVLTVLKRLSEFLSLFNPSLVSLIPEQSDTLFSEYPQRSLPSQAAHLSLSLKTHQAIDSDRSWKLVLLLVPVDDLCGCPEQASSQVATAVHEFDQALQTLHGQLVRTVVNAMVWTGHGDVGHSQKERECHCKETNSAAELSLTMSILALSLQESLKRHLEVRPWYNDGENFAVLLQETPMDMGVGHISGGRTPLSGQRTVNVDKVATQLWTNLLQPRTGESDLDNHNLISGPCRSEYQPFLRTQRNSPPEPRPRAHAADSVDLQDQKTGSELTCEDRSPSPMTPTSVHTLRPADIKVLAALGDSLTAANGAGGSPNNILDVMVEYRGLSWSIGGDENLTSVTTLPNIFREFNPNLTGFAVGTGKEGSPNAFLNQAVAGANSDDMVGQVRVLVEKMRNDPRIDFENDWKVITMFIGGNDLCDHCTDTVYFSPNNFVSHVRQALDILHQEVPRALVNLVELLNIIPLRRLHQDNSLNCPTWLVNMLCRCVVKPPDGSAEVQVLKDLNRAYQSGMRELVESGRYDTHSNFTVVVQPFFREVVLPLLEDGRPDRSFFASDCFHLSQKSHSLMARALWNNMLEPLGNKTYTHDFTDELPLKCPSQASPFLRTYKNSNYNDGPAPTTPPITNWGSDFSCAIHGPSDPVPSSVHRLRPADIKVVAALGDSLSAGFGAKSKNLLQLKNEYRGVSWSIGGDQTLETVTTLANILRKFNPSLHGFSTGVGTAQRGFNMAVSGAKAFDIPAQVEKLIQALRDSKEVDFKNDWKLVTLFIGGNDLCQYCQDRASLSPQNYSHYLMESLDLLYRNVPRMLVNVLEILQIDGLRKIKRDSLGCSLLQNDLAWNRVCTVESHAFSNLPLLARLDLTSNLLSSLPATGLQSLTHLKLAGNVRMKELLIAEDFPVLRVMEMPYAFQCCAFVACETSPKPWATEESSGIEELRGRREDHDLEDFPLELDEDPKFHQLVQCSPAPGALQPCSYLFGSWVIRASMWLIVLLSLICNILVACTVFLSPALVSPFKHLVGLLAVSDCVVGLSCGVQAMADALTLSGFAAYAAWWEGGMGCKITGFLSVFAGETSVFLLTTATVEYRLSVRCTKRSGARPSPSSIRMISGLCFGLALAITAPPVLYMGEHTISSLCLPLLFGEASGMGFVVALVLLNLLCYFVMTVIYTMLYWSLAKDELDSFWDCCMISHLARLLVTNCLLYIPVAFLSFSSLLSLSFINPVMIKSVLLIIVPLPACLNPLLYVFFNPHFKEDLGLFCKQAWLLRGRHQASLVSLNSEDAEKQSCDSMQALMTNTALQEAQENEERNRNPVPFVPCS